MDNVKQNLLPYLHKSQPVLLCYQQKAFSGRCYLNRHEKGLPGMITGFQLWSLILEHQYTDFNQQHTGLISISVLGRKK